MELVHIVAGGPAGRAVFRDAAPDLVLDDQHPELFQLFTELLDVIADQAVLDIDVGTVVEEVQGSLHIDLQRRRHMVGFLFLLLKEGVVEVLQKRHVFRHRILEIFLVDLVYTTVDDRLFHRLQAFLSADHQLAEGQDEVGFQGQRVILIRVVLVDIHRIHVLGGSRADVDDLALQLLHQGGVLCFRITDDHIIIRHQESIGDLTLGTERLTGTGGSEDQAVRVLQGFAVHHDEVVGKSVQSVVKGFLPGLEQLLGGKGYKNRRARSGESAADINEIMGKRQAAHEGIFLLEVQAPQHTVMFLGDTGSLENIRFQLLLGLAGIHDEHGDEEHTLVLALQLLEERLRILTVGSKVTRDDVHIVAGPDSFFLFLDLGPVKFRDRMLDGLDGLRLVDGLDVHRDDLARIHVQEVLQELVGKVRCRNGEIAHGTVEASHLEYAASRKSKGRRGDEVLHGKTGSDEPLPVEPELILHIAHVEHVMHELQAFLAVHDLGPDAQLAEVVHQVVLDMGEPRLCLADRIRLNAEGQVLGLREAVVSLGELRLQHLRILLADIIEAIMGKGDPDACFEALGIRRHVHEGELKVNRAVEKVQETAPFL